VESILKQFKCKSLTEDKVYDVRIFDPYRIVEEINTAFPPKSNRFAVNLGSGDGKAMSDPVYPLFEKGYGGLCVEGEANEALFTNLPASNISKLIGTFITPNNICEILDVYNCPKNCDFFKIDLDGYDGVIVKKVLESGYRPKVMQVEINPEIPPPLSFCVLFDEQYRPQDADGNVGGFYGMSMGYVAALCKPYGYHIAQVDFVTPFTHDVTLVHEEFLPVLTQHLDADFLKMDPREVFLAHPPGWSHFQEYGIDSMQWRYQTDYFKLVKDVWQACITANQRKHQGKTVPFLLS